MIGADAFAEIATWKDYPAILDSAHFAVVTRPGFPVSDLSDQLPLLANRMTRPSLDALAQSKPFIFLIDAPTAAVSSTAIRDRCARGESIIGLVPGPVQQHIEQHRLYTSMSSGRRAGERPASRAAGGLHGRD